MGMDLRAMVEVRINGYWLACKEDGSLFDSSLNMEFGKDNKPYNSTAGYDAYDAVCEACEFDIPRNTAVHTCILGWDMEDNKIQITPAFNPTDVEESIVSVLGREMDDDWIYALSLRTIQEYPWSSAKVYDCSDESTKLLKDIKYMYKTFENILDRMKAAYASNVCNSSEVRLIMYVC